MEKTQIINLTKEGLRPSKIASYTNLAISEVVGTLEDAISNHKIKRSQVLDTFEKHLQQDLSIWIPAIKGRLERLPIFLDLINNSSSAPFDLSVEELKLCMLCYEGVKEGEIYEVVCNIERTLHAKIKAALIRMYGEQDAAWWRKGVPSAVRKDCAARREDDENFTEYPPYTYTTLGELSKVLEARANASIVTACMPLRSNGKPPSMDQVKEELSKLTGLRNKVMHPIGAIRPSEDDLFFAKELQEKFKITEWRLQGR